MFWDENTLYWIKRPFYLLKKRKSSLQIFGKILVKSISFKAKQEITDYFLLNIEV